VEIDLGITCVVRLLSNLYSSDGSLISWILYLVVLRWLLGRHLLVGGTANFVLMHSPNTASGGEMAEMENASRVYGNSES
jgi:hypothetical protein